VKLYPEIPQRRNQVIARDIAIVGAVLAFAFIGYRVFGAVDRIGVLGTGVTDAGNSVQGALDSAANSISGVPVVGDSLANALGGVGAATGGNAAELGRAGTSAVHRLAVLLGLLTFLLPTGVLLGFTVPGRISGALELHAAHVAIGDLSTPERRRLLATRAAYGLPYRTLQQFTNDPLGDLEAGRYDALVEAALNEAGLTGRGLAS